MRQLSFFACAMLAAATASGVELIDLTAAVRKVGNSARTISTMSQCTSHKATAAFDDETNVYSGAGGTVWYVNVINSGFMLLFW